MNKRLVSMLAATLLLAACGGNLRTAEVARYDLGRLAGSWGGSRVPVAAVEVRAASWLAGPAMHFRLAYSEPLRRQSYAESRWAAPPAELLEAFLARRILFGQPDSGARGCRLQLVLDELEQRFDDPQNSTLVLDVRATLTPARGGEVLSKRAFQIHKAAAAPTASAGVAAAGEAARALADELGRWLTEASKDMPNIMQRCSIQ